MDYGVVCIVSTLIIRHNDISFSTPWLCMDFILSIAGDGKDYKLTVPFWYSKLAVCLRILSVLDVFEFYSPTVLQREGIQRGKHENWIRKMGRKFQHFSLIFLRSAKICISFEWIFWRWINKRLSLAEQRFSSIGY